MTVGSRSDKALPRSRKSVASRRKTRISRRREFEREHSEFGLRTNADLPVQGQNTDRTTGHRHVAGGGSAYGLGRTRPTRILPVDGGRRGVRGGAQENRRQPARPGAKARR